MVYSEWLPEVDESWRSSPPESTPTTSGLLGLAQSTQITDSELHAAFKGDPNLTIQSWTTGVDDLDPKDCPEEHPASESSLVPKDWTPDDIGYHRAQFNHLASLWHKQSYDLYHRPFMLLSVVPYPYYDSRKKYDKLALRNTQNHRPVPKSTVTIRPNSQTGST